MKLWIQKKPEDYILAILSLEPLMDSLYIVQQHTAGEKNWRSMVGFLQAWYNDVISYTVMYVRQMHLPKISIVVKARDILEIQLY